MPGWGNYFRTGNAAAKFRRVDWYVVGRLRGLMVKKRGRNLHAGQADAWTEEWFNGHGLYRLRGTIRYPKAAQPCQDDHRQAVCGKTARTELKGEGERAARYRAPDYQ